MTQEGFVEESQPRMIAQTSLLVAVLFTGTVLFSLYLLYLHGVWLLEPHFL